MSGFCDVQINGYDGVDFNSDHLTADALEQSCEALQRDGVDSILATLITDSAERMTNRIRRIVEFREQNERIRRIIVGLHIEGPFISSERGYVGAHPAEHAGPADLSLAQRLVDEGQGLVKIVTLSPERDESLSVTRWLSAAGIIVSAGHCNPSLDRLKATIDAGLSMFTHLGNGCPSELPRHDNIIQRVLSLSDQLSISFIADGAHIPFFALRNYLNVTGLDRVVVVSDAISAAGCGPGRYDLGGQWVDVGADLVPRAADNSHLVGSATPLPRMWENLRSYLGLSEEECDLLTKKNPKRLIGLES